MTDPIIYEPFSVTFFPQAGENLLTIPESQRQITARSTWFRLGTGNWKISMTTVSWETVILQASRQGISGWDTLTTLRGIGNNITATSDMVSVSTGDQFVEVRPYFASPPSSTAVTRKYPVTLDFYPVPVFDGSQPT